MITCLSIPAYFRLCGGNHGGKKAPLPLAGLPFWSYPAMENEREILALQHQSKDADELGQASRCRPSDALNPIVFIAAVILRFETRGHYSRASRARPR